MKVSKITIGRLFNKGNYEHVRYELTVEVKESESATDAITNLERIVEALKPVSRLCISSADELQRNIKEIEQMKAMPAEELERTYAHYKGTREEIIARYEADLKESSEKRESALQRAQAARAAFDNLGGIAEHRDAKLDWETDYDDEY